MKFYECRGKINIELFLPQYGKLPTFIQKENHGYKCEISTCELITSSFEDAMIHLESSHQNVKYGYECEVCKIEFSTMMILLYHFCIKHYDNICPICKNDFVNLKEHILLYHMICADCYCVCTPHLVRLKGPHVCVKKTQTCADL